MLEGRGGRVPLSCAVGLIRSSRFLRLLSRRSASRRRLGTLGRYLRGLPRFRHVDVVRFFVRRVSCTSVMRRANFALGGIGDCVRGKGHGLGVYVGGRAR